MSIYNWLLYNSYPHSSILNVSSTDIPTVAEIWKYSFHIHNIKSDNVYCRGSLGLIYLVKALGNIRIKVIMLLLTVGVLLATFYFQSLDSRAYYLA